MSSFEAQSLSFNFAAAAAEPHLLIAGATGSGKSNALAGILLATGERGAGIVLVDPKRVELRPWASSPRCLRYASEPGDMPEALRFALALVERRYKGMAAARLRKSAAPDIYVVIDELADLCVARKEVQPLIQRLCQIGRAARVHVVAATQCPLAKILPTEIKVNFDARLGLRTRCAQDSRNILSVAGCEQLPRYGEGLYLTPEGLAHVRLPYVPDAAIDAAIRAEVEAARLAQARAPRRLLGRRA